MSIVNSVYPLLPSKSIHDEFVFLAIFSGICFIIAVVFMFVKNYNF